jgi:hypothetical protein
LCFVFSDEYIKTSNSCRHRLKTFILSKFPAEEKSTADTATHSNKLDSYLNVKDDFKTNLMWLSVFVRSVEGVGMRLPVNYRFVLQDNYFAKEKDDGKTIYDAVYQPDGDTFQNSPIKIVFFAGYHKKKGSSNALPLSSVSKVNVNASRANLPANIEYSNMSLEMEGVQCLWPRQEDLRDFLYLLGYHPYKNLGIDNHDFPWSQILCLFNEKDMNDPNVLMYMLRELSLEFLHDKNHDIYWNLTNFKNFIQFMTPIFSSTIEGDHRIELANRLLYGIALKEEVPFTKTRQGSSNFTPLPFNSTVHKPIQAVVYMPAKNSSSLGVAVTTHLMELSRKTANQKSLYIRDSWRSLIQSIYSALERDKKFGEVLYTTQKELYEEPLNLRQDPESKARKNRQRLSEVMADVIFAENPTATMAASNQPKPAMKESWKQGLNNQTWTVMDNNPFTTVGTIGVDLCLIHFTKYMRLIFFVIDSFHKIYASNIFCHSISSLKLKSPSPMSI